MMTFRKKLDCAVAAVAVGATIALAIICSSGRCSQAGSTPASASASATKAVATVNGEPIYEKDLLAAMPADAFESQLQQAKDTKLSRLIDMTLQNQFLKKNKVVVPEADIDKGIETFKVTCTQPGCPCCGGGYKSMQQFMDVNFFTMDEMRNRVRNSIGFDQLADRITRERLKPDSIANEVKQRRDKIEMDYRKLSLISFECGNDPDFYKNANTVWPRKEKLAAQAHQRLAKGEAFDKVAKALSEDKGSGPGGGALGCVPKDSMGDEVEAALRNLKPSQYSDVIKTEWGYCIVKFDKISDEDIAALIKEQMSDLVRSEVRGDLEAFMAAAKIVINDGTTPVASPATAPAAGPTMK
jgi:hypothetical protein